jgi:hypothetical protein
MKLNSQDLEKIASLTWIITTSVPKSFGKARVITTSNRTSLRCYNGSRVNRLLRYWILAAGPQQVFLAGRAVGGLG